MSLSDIKIQIQELYETDVSESLISKITDDYLILLKHGKLDHLKACRQSFILTV